tara:strand:- start:629 stop:853 length:225 start_codon:yes stop_codon:yes gene_type:complete
MNEKIKELVTNLIHYCYDIELKDFNEWYNDTDYYWDTFKELEQGIIDNWEDCKDHIFVTLFELDNLLREEKGEQ